MSWMGLLWAVMAGSAWGQVHLDQPHPAMACLGVPDAKLGELPEYPFELFKGDVEGRVKVQLTFTAPDQAPTVKVIEAPNNPNFEVSVRQHVKHLRVPCAQAQDLPFVLVRNYEFKKDSRQTFVLDDDVARSKQRKETLSCLEHRTGWVHPKYPVEASRRGMQGSVLVSYRFTSANEAPSFVVTAPPELAPLKESTQSWFGGMRLPCYDGTPFHGNVIYRFVMEGEAYGFKPDVTFQHFVALSSKSRRAALPSTSVEMGCPFDVRLTYFMPHRPNVVRQVGDTDVRRKPLLDWFADLLLQMPKDTGWAVFGDTAAFQVPCYEFK